jgi:hypothetical protein
MASNNSNNWMYWLVGGIVAILGYFYITNQKAGAGSTGEAESKLATRKTGCGCSAST